MVYRCPISVRQSRHMSSVCLTFRTVLGRRWANSLFQKSIATVAESRRCFPLLTLSDTHSIFFKMVFAELLPYSHVQPKTIAAREFRWNQLQDYFVLLATLIFLSVRVRSIRKFIVWRSVLLCALSYFRDITLGKKLVYDCLKMAGDCLSNL